MEADISQFFDSVSDFFNPSKNLPCTNRDIIHGCEKRVVEIANSGSDEQKRDSLLQLSWALVHSLQAEDVERGKYMLGASLANVASPPKTKERLYLLAVGCYKVVTNVWIFILTGVRLWALRG